MKRKGCFSFITGLSLLIYLAGNAPAQSVSVEPEIDRAPASAKQAST